MKEFQCGSLVPGCEWHARHEDEAEVIRKAAEHLRQTHGSEVHESTIEAIRSRIERVEEQA